jgi:class 3 adenylate cyclase
MTTEDFKRKLTTILHTDAQNYSRLMGEDEDATVRTLTAYREVMGVFIQKHRGRVVHGSGDSLLAEFVSVVDAVRGLRPHAPPLTMSVVLTGNKIQVNRRW